MLFGKTTHLVGLDIGSRTIKAGEITETKKGQSLKTFGMVDVSPGLIEDGNIRNPERVAETIKELFRSSNIKEKNVAISISGLSVIVKKINVQTMAEDRLQETISLEAEQYIPFDISDVNLDFQILGESEVNPNQMSVLLVAAKKETINGYMNLLSLAGLNPCVIDVDAFALQNIYELNYDSVEENVALIDIGASKTSLNILKENNSVFMRDVSLGCGQINQRIVSMINCTPEEAERIKINGDMNKISRESLNNIVSSVISDWCSEIRRAFDFFYSTYPDDHVEKIILSGGGGNIQEFRQLLAAETSAEVETINPFTALQIDTNRFEPSYLERVATQAAICLGLAVRRVDDK